MIKWRSLLIWTAVLAVLAGFVYFYEFKGEAGRESAASKATHLFDVKEPDISSVMIQRNGEKIEVGRQNGQWKIGSPVATEADQQALNDMTQNLSASIVTRYLSNAGNITQYGLTPPKIHIEFRGAHGETYTLDLGEKDYAGNNVYAKASSHSEILLLPSYLYSSFDKSLLDLRNRKPISLDTEKVSKIEFEDKTLHLVAEKSGSDWRILQPVGTAGDSMGISSYLGDVAGMEAAAFVDHPDADLSHYGLKPAAESLTITTGEGKTANRQKVLLGTKQDDRYYAQMEGSPAVFQLASTVAEKLSPTLFKLRDKRIVTMKLDDLKKVTVQTGGATYEFDKSGSKESRWVVAQPKNLAGKDAREWKFWFPLESLSADEIVDPPGSQSKSQLFANPAVRITLTDQASKEIEVLMSKPGKEGVWVKSSGANTVFRIGQKQVEDFTSGLKDVAD